MAFGIFVGLVEMSDAPGRRDFVFEIETIDVLVNFEYIVHFFGGDTEDVAVVDVEGFAVTPDLGFAVDDHPIFIAIVVMAIEAAAVDAFERSGAGDVAPGRARGGGHVVLEGVDDLGLGGLGGRRGVVSACSMAQITGKGKRQNCDDQKRFAHEDLREELTLPPAIILIEAMPGCKMDGLELRDGIT